jgi:DNA-binding NarL/FixJ family response regulator
MSDCIPVTTILIAEDDPLLCSFLVERLTGHEDLEVVGCAANGREAVDAVAELHPDILLLDLGLPELPGLKVLERLSAMEALPGVLVLSGDETDETQLEAARHGARGFLCKSRASAALPDAIRAVAAGEVWLPRHLIGRILHDYPTLTRRVREQERPVSQLTSKERDVLAHMARGMTNQRIAGDLQVSLSTVKVHLRNAFRKLEVSNRAEAAAYAMREGLLESSS